MTIYLVRHAKAGDRSSWSRDDLLRPLSRRGQTQAEGLLAVFADRPVDRLLSSPYVRCLETLAPLAATRRIPIEPADALAEGAALEEALTLVRKHAHHDAVLCTHGDVLPMLLDHWARGGVDLGPEPSWPKGCTWVLHLDQTGDVVSVDYVAPPADE